jgi:uncharacterized protein (TIGR03000 family)
MRRTTFAATASISAVLLVLAPLHAGGVRGTMFNLPPGANPIDANEPIVVLVTDFESSQPILPKDAKGKDFPSNRVEQNFGVQFTGPAFEFTLPDIAKRTVVNVQFFRSNGPGSALLPTQIISAVVVDTDVKQRSEVNIVVPRPTDMGPCYYQRGGYIQYQPRGEGYGGYGVASRSAAPAQLVVQLPASAELRIDGAATRSLGQQRTFITPPLDSASDGWYLLEAVLPVGAEMQRVSRYVAVRGNSVVRVDLRPEFQQASRGE